MSGYRVARTDNDYCSTLCDLYLLDGGANDYFDLGIIYTVKVLIVYEEVIYLPG